MYKNYFKTAFRNFRKNRLFTAINIFGLTAAFTSCILIVLFITQELSYDKFNVNADRIVRATMEYRSAGTVNSVATTGTRPGPEFQRRFPEVESYTRTYVTNRTLKVNDRVFDEEKYLFADPSLFKMFSFPITRGNAATALDAADKVVITESAAKKYFGTEDPVNKTISSGSRLLTVSAVCADPPGNSQIKFDFVSPFLSLNDNLKDETWWTANWITYLMVKRAEDIPALQNKIGAYMHSASVREDAGIGGNDYLTYHLEPLTTVHLHSNLAGFEPNGSIRFVYMLSAIALLILIIAFANYTNLTTAQSATRAGEIGMRKVMGASKRQVFVQFISESSLVTFIAILLAASLSVFLLPYFNELTGKQLSSSQLFRPVILIALIIIGIIFSFFAGLYPAIVLSRSKIMNALKKGFNFTGGSQWLRKTLIVAQFSISVFLIIYTVIILQQMNFLQHKDLGYDKDHLLVLPIRGSMHNNFESLKAAFSKVKGVQSVSASYETPEDIGWGDGITAYDEKGKHVVSLNALPVDLDFTKTMKIRLAAGRDFTPSDRATLDSSANQKNPVQPYIINETLAKTLGWKPEEAIGKTIEKGESGPVVGVVKDFNFNSLHQPIGPLLIFLGPNYNHDFLIRIDGNGLTQTISEIEKVWKERIGDQPFSYHFLDDDYNKLYRSEQRTSSLLTISACLAILLACLGLFGLAAFTIRQRTKEIGIRKVLGADTANIIVLVSKGFLQLVFLAVLIAFPLSWIAGNKWLESFAFRIPVSGWVFVITAIAALLIAFITLGYQAIKAAFANPVNSLRSE